MAGFQGQTFQEKQREPRGSHIALSNLAVQVMYCIRTMLYLMEKSEGEGEGERRLHLFIGSSKVLEEHERTEVLLWHLGEIQSAPMRKLKCKIVEMYSTDAYPAGGGAENQFLFLRLQNLSSFEYTAVRKYKAQLNGSCSQCGSDIFREINVYQETKMKTHWATSQNWHHTCLAWRN